MRDAPASNAVIPGVVEPIGAMRRHAELLPAHRARMEQTIADPDEVRSDEDYPNTRLFFSWYAGLMDGKNVVVVVVSAEPPRPGIGS